jgi:hypothetical protein
MGKGWGAGGKRDDVDTCFCIRKWTEWTLMSCRTLVHWDLASSLVLLFRIFMAAFRSRSEAAGSDVLFREYSSNKRLQTKSLLR